MSEHQAQQAVEQDITGVSLPKRPVELSGGGETRDEQAEYLAAYKLQLRRMSCPGCGEGEPNF